MYVFRYQIDMLCRVYDILIDLLLSPESCLTREDSSEKRQLAAAIPLANANPGLEPKPYDSVSNDHHLQR